ncbi:MAG: protein-disulfide reductase DsbD domain-containing protein [Terriglobus sp.]
MIFRSLTYVVLAVAASVGVAHAQSINAGQSPLRKQHVDFVAEGQTIAANKPAVLKLHLKVENGFHINSHVPKSEMLIPTKLAVVETPDADVKDVDFPAGIPFSFAFEPKQKLDVYQGDVILTAHLTAKPGQHTLKAALHYQACDQAACYPPKTLQIEQPFTAK